MAYNHKKYTKAIRTVAKQLFESMKDDAAKANEEFNEDYVDDHLPDEIILGEIDLTAHVRQVHLKTFGSDRRS